MGSIKQKNLDIYKNNQKSYALRYAKFPARIDDIDRAFGLYKGNKNISDIKVLELGCCLGREYSHIRTKTQNYLGIDIQDDNIKRAQKLYGKDRFISGDFENIRIEGGQDIIFAFASLLHCDLGSIRQITSKLVSSLSLGGVLYVSLKCGESYCEYVEESTGRVFYYYSVVEFSELLGNDVRIEYIDENNYNNQSWFTLAAIKK